MSCQLISPFYFSWDRLLSWYFHISDSSSNCLFSYSQQNFILFFLSTYFCFCFVFTTIKPDGYSLCPTVSTEMAVETDDTGNSTHSNEITARHQESCLWPNALQVIVVFFSLFIWIICWNSWLSVCLYEWVGGLVYTCFAKSLWKVSTNLLKRKIVLSYFILMRDLMRIFDPLCLNWKLLFGHQVCIYLEQSNLFTTQKIFVNFRNKKIKLVIL